MDEVKGHLSGCGFHMGCVLVDHLLSMCWSPRGVWLVERTGLLGLCVEGMWQRMREGVEVREREREDEGGSGGEGERERNTHTHTHTVIVCR